MVKKIALLLTIAVAVQMYGEDSFTLCCKEISGEDLNCRQELKEPDSPVKIHYLKCFVCPDDDDLLKDFGDKEDGI